MYHDLPEYLVTVTFIIAVQNYVKFGLWKINFQDANSHYMKIQQTRSINARVLKPFRAIIIRMWSMQDGFSVFFWILYFLRLDF